MTGVEIFLLLTGCVFMVGSFFIAEKLSPAELNKIAELSQAELSKIIDSALKSASVKIEEAIEEQLEVSSEKVDRALEKETNEKIMAISEYSDTVIENMNKTHNEIVFLYSMLNDKHTELTNLASDLQKIAASVKNLQKSMKPPVAVPSKQVMQPRAAAGIIPGSGKGAGVKPPASSAAPKKTEVKDNHNEEILVLHKKGLSDIEVAKKLGLGLGEVRLVIGLFKGEEHS